MKTNRSFMLCATDFSARATDAANVAAKLAQRRGEALRLVHTSDSPGVSVAAALRSRLEAEAARLRKSGVDVEPVLLDGRRPADKLLDYLRAEPPSLIVVGCANKGALDRWALGSFSERVAEGAPVPTLVVRNPAVFDSWDWTRGRLTVLLALDFSASSDVVLRWARQFQLAGPCDLVACHVNWKIAAPGESGVGVMENDATLQKRLERDLRKKVRDQLGDDTVPVVVRPFFGDPGPCIVDIATEQKAQLIAIGTHQRQGLHRLAQFSVSREVLHQSEMNVVCVPVAAKFDASEAHIPELRRVLVATDFSDLGNTAVPYACAAASIGGLVKIVYVSHPRRRGAKPAGATNPAEALRALIPREMGARGQPCETEVLEDADVAGAICREAERFGADLICLASHGLGASAALHGSVAKAVLKKSRRPVLVVRRP
jgi:nucleotide-binding universal stress UspA family protein